MPGDARLILFDCDGTLVDSHGQIVHAMQQAFVSCDVKPPNAVSVRRVIGLSLAEAVSRLQSDEAQHDCIVEAYRGHYRAGEMGSSLFPGVRDTLQTLYERGYWLGIVTGKSRPGLLRVLDQLDLNPFFHVWRTADCCPSKPHPAMVEECMAEMGVGLHQTTVVGDACFDIQMAMACGVRALAVSSGVESPDALRAAGAFDVVDEFTSLMAYFPLLHASHAAPHWDSADNKHQ
ncbi:MAG: HAD-IIIA family hydrolase [Mariprofundaceae bacterium]